MASRASTYHPQRCAPNHPHGALPRTQAQRQRDYLEAKEDSQADEGDGSPQWIVNMWAMMWGSKRPTPGEVHGSMNLYMPQSQNVHDTVRCCSGMQVEDQKKIPTLICLVCQMRNVCKEIQGPFAFLTRYSVCDVLGRGSTQGQMRPPVSGCLVSPGCTGVWRECSSSNL